MTVPNFTLQLMRCPCANIGVGNLCLDLCRRMLHTSKIQAGGLSMGTSHVDLVTVQQGIHLLLHTAAHLITGDAVVKIAGNQLRV